MFFHNPTSKLRINFCHSKNFLYKNLIINKKYQDQLLLDIIKSQKKDIRSERCPIYFVEH